MAKSITYRQLHQFLLDLGFTKVETEGPQRAYRHEPSDTTFIFGDHTLATAVTATDCAGVKRVLDEKGLLSKKEFDELAASGVVPAERPTAS